MKIRYRAHKPLFGKTILVLQIGVESKLGLWDGYDPHDCGAPPNYNPEEIITTWRDAKVEDLTLLEEK